MPTFRPALLVALALFLGGCIVVVQEAPPANKPPPEPKIARVKGDMPIPNADFESGDGFVRPWETAVHASAYSYRFDVLEESARSGKVGLRLQRVDNEPWGGIVQAIDFNMPKGQQGTFSVWVRTPELHGSVEVFIRVFPIRGEPVYFTKQLFAAQRSGDWQLIEVDFEAAANARRLWVGINLYDGDYIDVDDTSLTLR